MMEMFWSHLSLFYVKQIMFSNNSRPVPSIWQGQTLDQQRVDGEITIGQAIVDWEISN